ncbi:hypothetical protein S245_024174, partial [Arachis hypogaea]
ILLVPEDPATGEPERRAPHSARLFGLKNAGFYGRSATPGCRRRPWGDLVVPTGWRQWGRSMDFLSFCCISFKGANLILFPKIPDEETLGEPPTPTTVHVRSLLDLTNYPSYLFY